MSSDPFGFSRATATRKSESPDQHDLAVRLERRPERALVVAAEADHALPARAERGVEVAVGAQAGDAEPARRGAEAGDHDPPVGLHEHRLRLVVATEADPLLPVAGEARVEVTRGHVLTLLGLRPAPLGRDVRSPSPRPHAAPSLEPCPPHAPCSSSPWPPWRSPAAATTAPAPRRRATSPPSPGSRTALGRRAPAHRRAAARAGARRREGDRRREHRGARRDAEVDFDHSGWGGNDVEVEATVPELTGIEVSGSGDLDADGIDAIQFELLSTARPTSRSPAPLAGSSSPSTAPATRISPTWPHATRASTSAGPATSRCARSSVWTSRSTAQATSATTASPP